MPGLRSIPRMVLLLMLANGCTAAAAEVGLLAGNQLLPAKSIQESLRPADWEYLSARKISRLVSFRAAIRDDATVRLGRIFRALPDGSWN